MPLVLADRVRDTTTTTGTGTITLSGTAPTGYQNFSVIGNGNTTYYTINAGSQWEVGIGTYSSAGPTLARTTVLESSNGGALVNFSAGVKDVFVTYPADEVVIQDGATIAAGTAVLGVANGGTGLSSTPANGALDIGNGTGFTRTTLTAGTNISITNGAGSITINATDQFVGTVTSVAASGGTTGMTFSGSPITTSGTLTLGGTLNVANGGTGVTTSTGTGSVVLNTSPTLVTPTLGAASATSIANGLGSVGAPSYTFTGDTNTGIYSPAADTLAFVEGGVEAMRIDSAGNVGIGTTSPTFASGRGLHINAPTGQDTRLKLTNADSGTGAFDGFDIGVAVTGAVNLIGWEAQPMSFFTSGTERMRIDSSGYLLVNRSSRSSSVAGVRVETEGRYGSTVTGSAGYSFGTNGTSFTINDYSNGSTETERMRIDGSGNLLVGTTTTAYGTAGRGLIEVNGSSSALIAIKTGDTARGYFAASSTATELSAVGASQPLLFTTNSAERMRIDTAGNMLLGTTVNNFGSRMEITATGLTNLLSLYNTTAGGGAKIRFLDGSSNAGVGNVGGNLIFYAEGADTERARIGINGNFLIGTTVNYSRLTVSSGNSTRSGITISDANTASLMMFAGASSNAVIAIDTNSLVFKTGATAGQDNGTDRLTINSAGNVTANVDLRAPIFYDSNNTAFYLDPASTSFINALTTAGALNAGNGTITAAGTTFSNVIAARGSSRVVLFDGNGSGNPSVWWSNGGTAIGAIDAISGGGLSFWANNTSSWQRQMVVNYGNVTVDTDIRAPIFYDSNNTAFYTDPASTSVLNTVNLSRINMANSNSVYADGDGNAGWRFGGTGYVYLNQAGLTYAQTAIVARGGVSNDSAGLLTLLGGTSGGTQINTDTRSPIYYDSNNTAFYVDPASGSRLGGQVTFNGGTNIASNGDVYARRDSGATGVYYFADGGSKFLFWDGTRYLFGSAGPVDAAVSYRAPFFYDLDNTGYFANPAGTSILFNFQNINQRCAYDRAWDNYPSITVYNTTDQGPQGDFRIHGAPGSSGGDFNVRLLVDGNIHTLSDLVAGGGCYAQIYYDSNNTGYYFDPTSNTSLRTYGDWRADSSPWTGEFNGKIQYHANNWYFQGSSNWEFRRSDTANAFFVNQNGECTARSDYRAPIFYDSNDTFFYLNPNGYSQINGFGSVNASSGVGLNIMGNASNGAMMAFHRSTAFAINMGLDTDNVFRMGGWSAAANRLQMDMSGNLTMAGNVTAYSDARLKKDVTPIEGALDLVSKMRGVRFTRIENDERGVGVIAQEMLEVVPEVVQQGIGDDDTLSVAYGNLVGVLIEAIKELTARVAELEGK